MTSDDAVKALCHAMDQEFGDTDEPRCVLLIIRPHRRASWATVTLSAHDLKLPYVDFGPRFLETMFASVQYRHVHED